MFRVLVYNKGFDNDVRVHESETIEGLADFLYENYITHCARSKKDLAKLLEPYMYDGQMVYPVVETCPKMIRGHPSTDYSLAETMYRLIVIPPLYHT